MAENITRETRFSRSVTETLLDACKKELEAGGDLSDSIPLAIWRQRVERCAFTLSEDILIRIRDLDDCGGVTADELASALWLKDWLGESDWDGTGRHSGGTT